MKIGHSFLTSVFIFMNGEGIVTRRPLVLQLHKTEEGQAEYGEFLHAPKKKFADFGNMNLSNPKFLLGLRHIHHSPKFLLGLRHIYHSYSPVVTERHYLLCLPHLFPLIVNCYKQ